MKKLLPTCATNFIPGFPSPMEKGRLRFNNGKICRTLLLILFLFTAAIAVKAQNDLHFTHFMFNMLTYNPAVAGNNSNLEATLTGRKQWVGFNGAPTLGFINAHAYLYEVRGGIGLSLSQDKIGFENITTFKTSYAYHLKLKDGHDISAGLGLGFHYKNIDASRFILDDVTDNVANSVPKSKIVPDVNFGFEYNHKYLTAGLASTHIQQGIGNSDVFKIPRHYYVYVKGNIHASDDLYIMPAILTKTTSFISQMEICTMLLYQKKYWVGATYRTKEAFSVLAGLMISGKFKIGYSYDFNGFSKLKTYSSGSHEIMLAYVGGPLNKKHYHLKTPRFFN